ncbi:Acetate transporter GPR1/FUN34/SatP family [Fusarium oxysporum f. sp. vasinfectum]|nr:hypothetical protein FOTG_11686 [Fusarium oxysporum f. sp. vasinfectum 25433]KAK2681899.1 Acetate transporter GPR1/FUN34/SatP family [Fusarium oxysporum f. sp. vasinfectum]KAK2933670.1 Acetate transporter GPR1/FUN34/SatP family [Fusarium oxysporum f. sp. vasinfectum]
MSSVKVHHDEHPVLSVEETIALRRLLINRQKDPNLDLNHDAREVMSDRTPWGNPSSLGIAVFAVANTLIALHLMQVHGVKHNNVLVGILWFTGGVASWVSCIFELLLGNTFAYCVFGSFGGYYFAYATILTPSFQVQQGYESAEEFSNSIGVFFCVWASLFFIFLIASLRTNIIFVWIFVTVDATAWCLAGSNFAAGAGETDLALRLAKAGGALLFACASAGWYLLLVQLLEGVGYQRSLPVGILVKPHKVYDQSSV